MFVYDFVVKKQRKKGFNLLHPRNRRELFQNRGFVVGNKDPQLLQRCVAFYPMEFPSEIRVSFSDNWRGSGANNNSVLKIKR